MNPYTGHLVAKVDPEMQQLLTQGYHPVPQRLRGDAEKHLAGRSEAHVDLVARGPLQDWAGERRRKDKRKDKIAAKSRRINRAKR